MLSEAFDCFSEYFARFFITELLLVDAQPHQLSFLKESLVVKGRLRECSRPRASVSHLFIKTHNSESQGQEEAAVRRMSELFTCSTALKIINTLAKVP